MLWNSSFSDPRVILFIIRLGVGLGGDFHIPCEIFSSGSVELVFSCSGLGTCFLVLRQAPIIGNRGLQSTRRFTFGEFCSSLRKDVLHLLAIHVPRQPPGIIFGGTRAFREMAMQELLRPKGLLALWTFEISWWLERRTALLDVVIEQCLFAENLLTMRTCTICQYSSLLGGTFLVGLAN